MKFLRNLFFTGLIFFAAVYFGSNYLVAKVFENWLGVPVAVSMVHWGMSTQRMTIKNMRLRNPAGYSENDLAKISRIYANYDISGWRQGLIKLTRVEAIIDEVRLERKSMTESNLMQLYPLLGELRPEKARKVLPVQFEIEKVKLEMGRVTFQTQLGNDQVTENKDVNSPEAELTHLKTPDNVAVYAALLVLTSAGWEAVLPTQAEISAQIKTQVNDWIEQLRQQALIWQVKINQALTDLLNKK